MASRCLGCRPLNQPVRASASRSPTTAAPLAQPTCADGAPTSSNSLRRGMSSSASSSISCSSSSARHLPPPARRSTIAAARRAAGSDVSVSVPVQTLHMSEAPAPPPAPPCTSGWQNPALVCLAAAALVTTALLQTRARKASVVEEFDTDAMDLSTATDPRAFQRSLARTRQAAHITKAVGLNRTADPAKAYQELTRALIENSECRRPFNSGNVSREDLVSLYQLAIRLGDVPPHFATLLQLQEMLGISQEEAEKLELEIIQSPASFCI